jgi:hypothetical protein
MLIGCHDLSQTRPGRFPGIGVNVSVGGYDHIAGARKLYTVV